MDSAPNACLMDAKYLQPRSSLDQVKAQAKSFLAMVDKMLIADLQPPLGMPQKL